MPRPLSTPGKDPVPIVQEAGWAPGLVWTGAENVAPAETRSPDRPARSLTELYVYLWQFHVWYDFVSWETGFWLFKGTYFLHLQESRQDLLTLADECCVFFWNIRITLPHATKLYLKRTESSATLLQKFGKPQFQASLIHSGIGVILFMVYVTSSLTIHHGPSFYQQITVTF
jgi:hypothetical protein